MTNLVIVGTDPGPTSGIVVLNWRDGAALSWPPDWVDSYQCDAVNAPPMLSWIIRRAIENECQLRGAIEEFREGIRSTRTKNPQDAKITRALVPTLIMTAGVFGMKLQVRPASTVKTWATGRRMTTAGVQELVPAKMIDAVSASQQAVFEATACGALPDPLSRKVKVKP